MIPVVAGDDTIVQQVTIKAPARRIFDALTDPKELLRWWNVEGKFQLIHAESDLRPGGKWSMQVAGCGPDRTSSIVRGEYRFVEPPSLLVFTWIREEEHHPETLVRWNLEEKDGSTTVRVTHSGLTSERLRARNSGWPTIVKLLQTYIASATAH
jgi:uncharacterized protein YndB with AHSA1/START domain